MKDISAKKISVFVLCVMLSCGLAVCQAYADEQADAEATKEVTSFSLTSKFNKDVTEDEQEQATILLMESKFETASSGEDSSVLTKATTRETVEIQDTSSWGSAFIEEVESTSRETSTSAPEASSFMSGSTFAYLGVVRQNGVKYTYYSSRVLRHVLISNWVCDSEGFWRTRDGYYVVAANHNEYAYGSIVYTPWGKGKVLDCGCNVGTIDMYVNF